jgi:nitrate reductase gamma subunit
MDIAQDARDRIIDEEHLRLLTLGHYITGGMAIAFASLFIFHFIFILVASASPEFFAAPGQAPAMPDAALKVFAVMVGMFIVVGWAFGAVTIYAGRCINRRARRTLTMVVACLNTLFIPFGTVLGVFTLIVMSRGSVKHLYGS